MLISLSSSSKSHKPQKDCFLAHLAHLSTVVTMSLKGTGAEAGVGDKGDDSQIGGLEVEGGDCVCVRPASA